MAITPVNAQGNGLAQTAQQVSPFDHSRCHSYHCELAPCQNSLCYNGGYCDDDGKGKDGCVCVNGWLGANCRGSKSTWNEPVKYN